MNETPDMRAYRLLQRTIVFCAAIVLGAVMLMFLVALDKSQARCNDLQNMRSYILGVTERSAKTLPTLAYYRNHPDELERAQHDLDLQRQAFADPLHCSIL